MDITLRLTGLRPMMQHNGRMANPLDPYARRLKELTSKRNKTDEDMIAIMQVEARGACYETAEETMGVPTAAVWRCIFDAAKAYKRGEDIKRALSFEDITQPLLISGREVKCVEFLNDAAHVDYRPVKLMGRKTMRARPIVAAGWQTTHQFSLLEDVINPRDLVPIFERAGRLGGLAEWRPIYGTFSVEVV